MSSPEEMLKLIEAYQKSGLSQKKFCWEFGIKPSTFSYWVRKERLKDMSKNGFVKIDTSSVSSENLEVCYPNGVKIKVDKKDIALVNQLIGIY